MIQNMPAAKKASKKGSKKKSKTSLTFARKPLRTAETLSRRTITIRPDTEKSIDALVGPRKFSAFVQTALDHQLQRERIDQWLAEEEEAHGPLRAEDSEFAERAWQSRK